MNVGHHRRRRGWRRRWQLVGTNFNVFLTWNTMERSSPLQIGLRRRRRSRRSWRYRRRWRRANFKFIHRNFHNSRLSFFSLRLKTPPPAKPKVLRCRRPVKVNLKVIKRPVSTTTTAGVPQRLLPEIGIRTAAPPQPSSTTTIGVSVLPSIWRIHQISINTLPWPINKIRNSSHLSIVV